MLISIGDAIRPGRYVRHSMFRRVGNYIADSGLISANACRDAIEAVICQCCGGRHSGFLSLADETVGTGPFTIVVRRESCNSPLQWPQWIDVDDGVIRFDGERADNSRVKTFVSTIPSRIVRLGSYKSYKSYRTDHDRGTSQQFQHHLPFLKNHLINHAPPRSMVFLLEPARRMHFQTAFEIAFCERMIGALNLWRGGSNIEAVSRIKGCGFGLTPGGDDVIAGIMVGLHVAGSVFASGQNRLIDSIRDHSFGGNPISNACLCAAAAGRVNEAQKELLLALCENRPNDIVANANKVMAAGETSGADWLTGLMIGVETPGEGHGSLSGKHSSIV